MQASCLLVCFVIRFISDLRTQLVLLVLKPTRTNYNQATKNKKKQNRMKSMRLEDIENVLRTRFSSETLSMFVATRVNAAEAAAAVGSLARDLTLAQLKESKELKADATEKTETTEKTEKTERKSKSVLELRDIADATWQDLGSQEPACQKSVLNGREIEIAVRAISRENTAQREDALVFAISTQAERAFLSAFSAFSASSAPSVVLFASECTRVRAAALRVMTLLSSASFKTCDPTSANAGNEETFVTRALQKRALKHILCPADIRNVERSLHMSSISKALAFCVLSLMPLSASHSVSNAVEAKADKQEQESIEADEDKDDKDDKDENADTDDLDTALLPVLLGVPAMLREARPHTFSSLGSPPNPACVEPKRAGGALPALDSFLVCCGGRLEFKGRVVARVGGATPESSLLLTVLPGWTSSSSVRCMHYVCVDRHTRVASLLRVTANKAGDPDSVLTLLRFELGVDEDDPRKVIGWIDAQRDFEGNLALAWGSFNPLTGGVARSYIMGLEEFDDERKYTEGGVDPFRELNKDDIDAMFAARFEAGAAIDFRDHGSLLEASVLNGVTTVVHHDTIVKVLHGIEFAAVWGTAHAWVGWVVDSSSSSGAGSDSGNDASNSKTVLRAKVWRGALTPEEVNETWNAAALCALPVVHSQASASKCKSKSNKTISIAPWWPAQ
jgi:hypothetical protein